MEAEGGTLYRGGRMRVMSRCEAPWCEVGASGEGVPATGRYDCIKQKKKRVWILIVNDITQVI